MVIAWWHNDWGTVADTLLKAAQRIRASAPETCGLTLAGIAPASWIPCLGVVILEMNPLFRLLVAFAWPMLVIWAALQVGHSLQVIDNAKVIVRDKAACEALQIPYDTTCRVVGRMEANLDGTWWIQPKDAGGIYIRLPEGSLPYSYSPDDYHILGGKPLSIALVVVTALLALLGPLTSWRIQARRAKRAAGRGEANG